jgi:hypothetical protein
VIFKPLFRHYALSLLLSFDLLLVRNIPQSLLKVLYRSQSVHLLKIYPDDLLYFPSTFGIDREVSYGVSI